jgi:filamentous hemagglutinin family protein
MKCVFSLWLGVCGILLAASGSMAQVVEQDATRAVLTGNQFEITGGNPAGTNLFHSFSEFSLGSTQTANFQVPGTIQNVFSRVTGGNPSVINGAITAAGGAPNLYFMNPSGVVFGPNFTLNIPASFTATTANGIAFGSNWFSATGLNNYANLLGEPTAFGFTMAQPAAIINQATIDFGPSSANSQHSLALIAGTVISPGTLKARSSSSSSSQVGTVTIAAVPGHSLVRINSPDMLLGLEIRPFQAAETQPNTGAMPIPSLAELVTGRTPDGMSVGDATGVSQNPDGTLTLTGAGMAIQPGDVLTEALNGYGVLIGAPTGNVTVATIKAENLGVDITAGKLFQATKTFDPAELSSYRSLFQEALLTSDSELLAFLKLKTGLSDADILSKYPVGGPTTPYVTFPTMASIFIARRLEPRIGNVVIRHGGGAQLDLQGRSGATMTGNAPFSIGGKVTLDSPNLADRYSLANPAATFRDLAASTPSGTPRSEDGFFDLSRNQTTAMVPIPANSSGTVGAIVQTIRGDGGLTIAFADQVFNPLPIAPPVTITPPPTTTSPPAVPTTSTETTIAPPSSAIGTTQVGERGANKAQCEAKSANVAAQSTRSGGAASVDCAAADEEEDAAILKILE